METVLQFILGVLIIAFGVAVSIGLHEVGHLLPAKLFGIKVTQYMIGFGPTIWSRRKGETEYGVKAIPLGGYISMAGMFPPRREGEAPRTARPTTRGRAAGAGGCGHPARVGAEPMGEPCPMRAATHSIAA